MKSRPVIFRRQYLIKKGLQFRYIGIVFSLALLASVVTGYTVFATGWTLLGEKLANVYPQGRLIYVIRTTNLALIRNLLFVSPFIFFLGLLFSHKIAGPVYRIEKSIEEIKARTRKLSSEGFSSYSKAQSLLLMSMIILDGSREMCDSLYIYFSSTKGSTPTLPLLGFWEVVAATSPMFCFSSIFFRLLFVILFF